MKGRITQGPDITADVAEACDVCIIGSGAGGGILAAGLMERSLDVVMLEAGGYHTRRDFDLHEQTAFPMLYQGRGGRSTVDLAISILQGRSVGGGTTINWTTCFRTPERILAHWQAHHGIEGLDAASLAPHFEAVEARLNIHTWPEAAANANNRKLLDGCRKLGWEASPLRRNVKGCANSGFCGMGCPVDGKQSQHVTSIPDAVAALTALGEAAANPNARHYYLMSAAELRDGLRLAPINSGSDAMIAQLPMAVVMDALATNLRAEDVLDVEQRVALHFPDTGDAWTLWLRRGVLEPVPALLDERDLLVEVDSLVWKKMLGGQVNPALAIAKDMTFVEGGRVAFARFLKHFEPVRAAPEPAPLAAVD